MIRATADSPFSACLLSSAGRVLTRLRKEEQDEELHGGRDCAKAYHPSPSSGHLLEAGVDSVRDDLTTGDGHDVHDDHASPKTRRGELLDVQRRDTGGYTDADADEETAADLWAHI